MSGAAAKVKGNVDERMLRPVMLFGLGETEEAEFQMLRYSFGMMRVDMTPGVTH